MSSLWAERVPIPSRGAHTAPEDQAKTSDASGERSVSELCVLSCITPCGARVACTCDNVVHVGIVVHRAADRASTVHRPVYCAWLGRRGVARFTACRAAGVAAERGGAAQPAGATHRRLNRNVARAARGRVSLMRPVLLYTIDSQRYERYIRSIKNTTSRVTRGKVHEVQEATSHYYSLIHHVTLIRQ